MKKLIITLFIFFGFVALCMYFNYKHAIEFQEEDAMRTAIQKQEETQLEKAQAEGGAICVSKGFNHAFLKGKYVECLEEIKEEGN